MGSGISSTLPSEVAARFQLLESKLAQKDLSSPEKIAIFDELQNFQEEVSSLKKLEKIL